MPRPFGTPGVVWDPRGHFPASELGVLPVMNFQAEDAAAVLKVIEVRVPTQEWLGVPGSKKRSDFMYICIYIYICLTKNSFQKVRSRIRFVLEKFKSWSPHVGCYRAGV